MRTFTTTSLTSFNVSFHMHFEHSLAAIRNGAVAATVCLAAMHAFTILYTIKPGKQLNILFLAQFYSFGTNSTDCHKNELFNMSKSPIKYMHHK